MIRAYLRMGAIAAILGTGVMTGPAGAASKEDTFKACEAEIKKEFGESPVTFDRFRRNDTRHQAIGVVTLSDGSTRQIRCRIRNGKLLDMKFRTDGGSANFWTDERPPEATFVEPEDESEDAATAGDGEATETAATGGGTGSADADAAEEKAPDEKAGEDTADGEDAAEEKVSDSRFKKPGGGPAAGNTAAAEAEKAPGEDAETPAGAGESDEKAGDEADGEKPETDTAEADDGLARPRFMKAPTN